MNTLRFSIGDVRVTRLEELYGPLLPTELIIPPDGMDLFEERGASEIVPCIADGLLIVSIHSWLVQTPQKTILIDTCAGNHKQREAMPFMHLLDLPFLDQLTNAGVQPEDVDAIVCTHLHGDHVGWNTTLVDGEWVPTFPNAQYHFSKTEFDYWMSEPDEESQAANQPVFADSVKPIFDHGLANLWEGDGLTIDDTLHMELAPGHTPGHAVGWLESRGERGLFSGDAMHSPIQVLVPEWSSGFCVDPVESAATRTDLLSKTVEQNAILMPAHFVAPHAFTVQPRGDGFKPVAIDAN